MAKGLAQRPSNFFGPLDPYTAWCIDEAVYTFGLWVEAEVKEAIENSRDSKSKTRNFQAEAAATSALNAALAMPEDLLKPTAQLQQGQFRDPMELIGK